MSALHGRAAQRLLATYETVFAASALVGGICLMAGAPGFRLPLSALVPLGLSSWALPGLALVIAIGGTLAWAAFAAWRGDPGAHWFGYAASVVLAGWLAIQFVVLGFREPVQWVTLSLAVVLVLLSRLAQRAVRS
ncbi:hypothetical protein DMP23_19215 [Amycolatopsis sp. A1MSW2902]|uniref:hypothetical protein n=1 Tax=Amycolatopsis sp. A1MSW2902 TaxID=687413 RepID=UPI00307E7056